MSHSLLLATYCCCGYVLEGSAREGWVHGVVVEPPVVQSVVLSVSIARKQETIHEHVAFFNTS